MILTSWKNATSPFGRVFLSWGSFAVSSLLDRGLALLAEVCMSLCPQWDTRGTQCPSALSWWFLSDLSSLYYYFSLVTDKQQELSYTHADILFHRSVHRWDLTFTDDSAWLKSVFVMMFTKWWLQLQHCLLWTFFCPFIYIFISSRDFEFLLFSKNFIAINLNYFSAKIVPNLASGRPFKLEAWILSQLQCSGSIRPPGVPCENAL